MGLFLPVLLLGFAQLAQLPITDQPAQMVAQDDSNSTLSSIPRRDSTLSNAKHQLENFDRIQVSGDPDGRSAVCLTMRSYYFQRRDGLAPEYVGMTTCDRAPGRILKKINRRPARLIPLNLGSQQPK